jgi:hypothetical protein
VAIVAALAPGFAMLAGPAAAAGSSDLAVTTSSAGRVDAGVPFDRSVTLRNRGPEPARDVSVVAHLAPGVRIATVLPELPGGTCTVVSVSEPSGPAWIATCRRGSLASGEEVTMRLPLVTAPSAPCGPLPMRVRVSASNEPANRVDARNVARVTDRLTCDGPEVADLIVTAEALARDPLPGGATFTYRMHVDNTGDEPASSAEAVATFPPGLAVRGVPEGPAGAHCATASDRRSARCRLGDLAPGARATVDVKARVTPDPRCTTTRVIATVRGGPRTLLPSVSRTSTTVSLACRPTIGVVIQGPAAAYPGGAVPVTVSVRSVGGAELGAVRVGIGGCERVRRLGGGGEVLGRGDRWRFRCLRRIGAADPVTVPVVAVGRDVAGQRAITRSVRRIDVWHPAIAMDVRPTGRPGDRGGFRAEVRNAGDTALVDVQLSVQGRSTAVPLPDLEPGASVEVPIVAPLPRRGAIQVGVAATDRRGRTVGDVAVVPLAAMADDVDGGSDGGDPASGRAGGPGGGSAFTGGRLAPLAGMGVALALTGGVLLLLGRRRRAGPDGAAIGVDAPPVSRRG